MIFSPDFYFLLYYQIVVAMSNEFEELNYFCLIFYIFRVQEKFELISLTITILRYDTSSDYKRYKQRFQSTIQTMIKLFI